MNISGLSVPGFKEFGGLDRLTNHRQALPSPSFDYENRTRSTFSHPAWGRSELPIANSDDSRSLFQNLNRFRGMHHGRRAFKQAFAEQPKARGEDVTARTRLDARSFSQTKQSTELTIRTKDGDLVTIKLRESEKNKESIQYRNVEGETGVSGSQTEIETLQKSKSREEFDLAAMFENGELSDVKMELNSKSKEYTEVNFRELDEDSSTAAQYQSMTVSNSRLSFEVQGHLDEDELEAIGNLLNDVDTLANEFFEGDVQAAFEQATQLGYDDSEIAGYALSLKEQETSVVSQKYRHSEAPQPKQIPDSVAKPVAAYIKQFEAVQKQSNFFFEREALDVMMDQIAQKQHEDEDELVNLDNREKFRGFNEKLLAAINELVG